MKVVIVGGAGVRTPQIIKTLYSKNAQLQIKEIVLTDIDQKRLYLLKSVNDELVAGINCQEEIGIKYTTDLKKALVDADFVLFTFRVGQIDSRIIDEQIPLKYGVVGQETTGPGGFAMAMRTIPVMLEYMKIISEVAPTAWVLNLTNPSGLITQALLNEGYERVIGLCDGPSELLNKIAEGLNIPREDLAFEYFGINHLGWVKRVIHQGSDITAKVLNIPGIYDNKFLSSDLIKNMGMIPNEYLFFYYQNLKAVNNLKKSRISRGQLIQLLNERLFVELEKAQKGESKETPLEIYLRYNQVRSDSYLKVESVGLETNNIIDQLWSGFNTDQPVEMSTGYGDIALEVMLGICGHETRQIILNVKNNGAILDLEKDDCVEVATFVGVHPICVSAIPEHAKGFLQTVKSYERLTIKAAKENCYSAALQALTIHPLVPDAITAQKILDDYIKEHKTFPELK